MSLLGNTDVVLTRSAASNSQWPCLVSVSCWESTLREHSRPVRVVERRDFMEVCEVDSNVSRRFSTASEQEPILH